ncbi:peptide chain release factor N(5)-glutamine methyltransferase [Minwuia sp. IMCC3077]|uniref:peptide chain release factor N(5)-glutamine methyltransferase n=1 Tax=Minwuia sp. IMCC3077 TaxID=3040676 RepID=UPI00247B00A4|nr:peptide chain release factor N(5)-glutamine methyltransferase [Minwuia sp. IMCC3077]
MPRPAEQETVGALLDRASRQLRQADLPSPRLDARVLLGNAMQCDPASLLPGSTRPVAPAQVARFDALIDGRLERRPVSHLTGRREFYGRAFMVTPDVLDPRPDSECVVELALRHLASDEPTRILDLGTGTGCLLLTLLAERPQAQGLGIDISAAALEVARGNAAALGLQDRAAFQQGEWLSGVTGHFDLIISNPPYIPSDDIHGLAPEVRDHEPRLALDGGRDGLDPYRILLPRLAGHLKAEGTAILEHGQGQEAAMARLAEHSGLEITATATDLGGINRGVALQTAVCAKKALGNGGGTT